MENKYHCKTGEQNEMHSGEMIPTALKLLQSQEEIHNTDRDSLNPCLRVQIIIWVQVKGKYTLNRTFNNSSCHARLDKSICLLLSGTQKIA